MYEYDGHEKLGTIDQLPITNFEVIGRTESQHGVLL